jgi:3-oxoacid CoA-transferase B subunit
MKAEERCIVERTARELQPGMTVNLGIGLPTKIPQVLPDDHGILFHSENGFVGMGPPLEGGTPDNDIIDAGGRACTLQAGAASFDSIMSFAIVRGGKLDVAVLGAFEVSIAGDLANWMIPGKLTPGMGGAMELAQKANRVIIMSRHLNKQGHAKVVKRCTLPLTAKGCVDTLITERALFRRKNGRLVLCSIAPDYSREDVLERIECDVEIDEPFEDWGV